MNTSINRLPDLFSLDPFDDGLRSWLRPLRMDLQATGPQMRLDVREQNGGYAVTAEIPGVRREDIDVRIDGNQVRLSAEVKQERSSGGKQGASEDERQLRSERYYGYISRTFSLDSEIDESKASAHYENGVLELKLPKKASGEARKLSVA